MTNRLWTALGAAAMSAMVSAQTPTPNNNCDILQTNIQDVHNAGAVGGVYGYVWGSHACNIGTQALHWAFASTPGLGMNAYRLSFESGSGRLVQIGQSWAKHACCVGNDDGCGICQPTGEAGLRPMCRDVYTAGFNAVQARLGPRSGIDAFLGTFANIPVVPTNASVIDRKVKIAQGDMSGAAYPNAVWFAEGVYVCAEEQPSRQLNNASWRRMTVANTGGSPSYNWSVPSGAPTSVGEPAINAWRAQGNGLNTVDTSVVIATADVPGEGRFHVAGKSRALGGGMWRYEYAVFNLNSDRSGGSFAVPLSSGAAVSEVGFHDVDGHSGEVNDGTDWVGAKVGSAVRWSAAADFATNPNGNAIRWGTMYNFWFTSNAAPAAGLGLVTLGLFKPGTVDEISVGGLPVPTAPGPCPADFNGVGGLTVQDIYDFLEAFFGGDARADFNAAGGVSVQDVFDFLAAYFEGCG